MFVWGLGFKAFIKGAGLIRHKIKSFFFIVFSLTMFLFSACENESDFSEDLKSDYSTVFSFFSENPEDSSDAVSVSYSYKIGQKLSSSDFPSNTSADFKNIIPGYKLNGWSYYKNPADGSREIPDFVTVNSDNLVTEVMVTSMPASFYVNEWEPISYSVHFNGNGGLDSSGNSVKKQTGFVYDQEKALEANPFTREKYIFSGWGWSGEQDARLPSFGDCASVTNMAFQDGEVVNLYALWLRDKITIAFDPGEGSGSMGSINVSIGDALPGYEECASSFTSPEGKSFINFLCIQSDGSSLFYEAGQIFSISDYPNDDVKLVAQYRWKSYMINLYYNFPGEEEQINSQQFEWGQKQVLMANPYSHFGYDFEGWNTNADGSGTSYEDGHEFSETRDDNLNLYAQWKEQKRTVTFNANGGSGSMSAQTFAGGSLPQNLSENAFVREGYWFIGWNTAADGSGTYYYDREVIGEDNWMSGDVTLYAQWSVITYTLDFDTDGGSNVDSQVVEHGKTATKPADPTKTGYTFAGWYTSSSYTESFDFSIAITENTTAFAKWIVESRTVYFDLNGGSLDGSGSLPSVTITYEELPYAPPEVPQMEGYLFAGWSPRSISSSNWATSDITMVAQWNTRGAIEGNLPANVSVEYTSTGMTFYALREGNYSSFQWLVDGTTKQNSAESSFTVDYADYAGRHTVVVIGIPADEETDVFTAGFKFKVE
ncbi:MAG: InlB B-repeat-containing protein [Treponema sp.]|nr:InlB B-repeat-containing protein [Treponema sp.]